MLILELHFLLNFATGGGNAFIPYFERRRHSKDAEGGTWGACMLGF